MTYLDGILAASTGSSSDESVAGVDHAADTVGVGVELGLEGLVLLVLALVVAEEGKESRENHRRGSQESGLMPLCLRPFFQLVQIVYMN